MTTPQVAQGDQKKLTSKFVIRTCPHCLKEYTLGIYGTVNGCDECEGIVRNPRDGSIIDMGVDEETFIKRVS